MSKKKKLFEQMKAHRMDKASGLYIPRTMGDMRHNNWPVCKTCRQDVEAVEMRNRNTKGVEIWARCHGKEDWFQLTFPFDIPEDDRIDDHIRLALRSFQPFDPSIA